MQKICCICGVDVRRMRRNKDRRGNYYCKPCYVSRLAEYRERLRELAAQSNAGTIVVAQRVVSANVVATNSGSSMTAVPAADQLTGTLPAPDVARFVCSTPAPRPPEPFSAEPEPEDPLDHSDESAVHLIAMPKDSGDDSATTAVNEVSSNRPRDRQAGWLSIIAGACIASVVVCALVALCLDRSPHVRLAGLLGLIGCAGAVAVTSVPGGPLREIPRPRIGEVLGFLVLLGTISAAAFVAFQVGMWRAGLWGGAWMAGAVVLAGALFLAYRPRTKAAEIGQCVLDGSEAASVAPSGLGWSVASVSDPVQQENDQQSSGEPRADAVEVRRRMRRRRGGSQRDVRISDLVTREAQAEVEAANLRPDTTYREPEVPVSPVTNPPMTTLVNEFSGMVIPESAGQRFAAS